MSEFWKRRGKKGEQLTNDGGVHLDCLLVVLLGCLLLDKILELGQGESGLREKEKEKKRKEKSKKDELGRKLVSKAARREGVR